MESYIICVDGGGTKTSAVAYDSLGNELSNSQGGFGNLTVNVEEALTNIEYAIKGAMISLRDLKCIHICVGLAGVEVGKNKEIVKDFLEKIFNVSVTVVNDAYLALNASLKGQEGILVISGTGSIAYGKYKNEVVRTGGWGHILGDEGSGYDIVKKAFKQMTLDKDDNKDMSNLTAVLLDKINAKNIPEAMDYVYKNNKGELASLVPAIVDMANEGDKDAMKILNEAGIELAELCLKSYKSLNINEDIKVAIKGSILTKVQIVRDSFVKELKNNLIKFSIIDDNEPSTKGGYYIFKNLNKEF